MKNKKLENKQKAKGAVLSWSDHAWEDYLSWQDTDPRVVDKINELIGRQMRFSGAIQAARRAVGERRLGEIYSAKTMWVRARYGVDLSQAAPRDSTGMRHNLRATSSDGSSTKRPMDAEPHLPLALGAALEVQSQVLEARGQRTQAIALLQTALHTYGNTSIHDRIQKNLNLLSFQGKVAPALKEDQFLGAPLPPAAQLKGSPVLLFFWAHWCGDCKAEAPIITQLRSEYAGKGLKVIGPTRFYGYTAQSEHASHEEELHYIDAVRHRFYSGLLNMPVPINKSNFDVYGASTTPTLVLLDKSGKVAWYHPGAVPYDELRGEIEKVVAR